MIVVRAVLLLLAAAGVSGAAQINWRAKVAGQKLLSTGVPLGSNFSFELGAFRGDFVPTRGNATEWRQNWAALATTSYNPQTTIFAASTELGTNSPPYTSTGRAYIWGFNASGETLLLTSPTWVWPRVSDGPGFPTNFFTADPEASAVVGTLSNADNAPVHLRAELLDPSSPSTYSDWLVDNFTTAERGDPGISGAGADADRDGVSNLQEFALGTLPKDPSSASRIRITRSGNVTTLEASGVLRAGVAVSLESSEALVGWAGEPDAQILQTSPATRIQTSSTKRFFRLRFSL